MYLQHESIFFFLQELEALRREMEKKEQEILELEALLQQDTKGPSAGMPPMSRKRSLPAAR